MAKVEEANVTVAMIRGAKGPDGSVMQKGETYVVPESFGVLLSGTGRAQIVPTKPAPASSDAKTDGKTDGKAGGK